MSQNRHFAECPVCGKGRYTRAERVGLKCPSCVRLGNNYGAKAFKPVEPRNYFPFNAPLANANVKCFGERKWKPTAPLNNADKLKDARNLHAGRVLV